MSLAVLSDEHIRQLIENLTFDEAERLQHAMKCALHAYSTGNQNAEHDPIHQPERTVVDRPSNGATTLFMPSSGPEGHGIKVVTVLSPSTDVTLSASQPTGSVTLFWPDGRPLGFLHARNLTAFRTALASTCLLTRRSTVKTVTVFGSGLQAYWHIRLAMLLRGSTIKHVYIINRRFSDSAKGILKKIYAVPTEIKQREGWDSAQFAILTPGYAEYRRLEKEHIRAADVIYCCTPSTRDLFDASILTNHEGRKKGRLIVAVGSYKPSMRELPKDLLLQAVKPHEKGHFHYHKHALEGGVIVVDTLDGVLKEAGEVIEAGLEPKQLVELGELVMIHKTIKEEEELASQASAETSSMDMDSLKMTPGSSAMTTVFGSDSGSSKRSLSKSPSRSSSTLSFRHHHRSDSGSSTDRQKEKDKREGHLSRWLREGNVIYKSVGLALMDLTVGTELISLAKERGVGTIIENFS